MYYKRFMLFQKRPCELYEMKTAADGNKMNEAFDGKRYYYTQRDVHFLNRDV